MRIQKVELEYFRGVGEKKEFSFEGKPFIYCLRQMDLEKQRCLIRSNGV